MFWCVILLLLLATTVQAQQSCVTFDAASWTAEERSVVTSAAIVLIPEIDQVAWKGRPPTSVRLCSSTVSVASLTAEALRTQAQTTYAAQVTAGTARETEASDIADNLAANQFCHTSTLAQIASRIATEKAAVQADITAATDITTIKTAMTTLNDRIWPVVEAAIDCTVGERRVRR